MLRILVLANYKRFLEDIVVYRKVTSTIRIFIVLHILP